MRREILNEVKIIAFVTVAGMAVFASMLLFGLRAKAATVRDGVHTPVYEALQTVDRGELADMRNAEEWVEPWVCPISQSDLDLLAAIVYAEAGDQGHYGMRLVCDVILNRVDSPAWPDTIPGVVYQTNQFSPVFDGGLDRAWSRVTAECYDAVLTELQYGRIDYGIQYFSMYGCQNGQFAFQYLDHYFGY